MKCNTWARRFGKNLIFRRPRASFWIVSGLPTIRPESRVRSSLIMGERYICRVRTEHFTLSLSSKYADGPQQALTGIHW
jgi:hypothetical protein